MIAAVENVRAVATGFLEVARLTARGAARSLVPGRGRGGLEGEALRQMFEVGNRSVLFVCVTLGFIGMVLVYQTCLQVNRVTGDLSQVGGEYLKLLIHEFGPTLTAMMLATRVGAGIAAEIGSMVVTEQVDALRMSGVEPVEYLVVPRFLAALAMQGVLTILGTGVAVLMGMATAYASFHVNPTIFLDPSKVQAGDLLIGFTKAMVYGASIPIVSGYCGLEAGGGSQGVGQATTRAVIASSFVIILEDFVISGVGFLTVQ
jgi:phospholipid/cholesterol/gamma-HCH transport system permease protein